ncbi:hypothetical protein CASFOL_026514 [Castilleja foliolosa]|uniref:Uncharacterized protein n=1 Tax=Castilleja foliolosa TaxID=1961234 RepID=A0ABD3CI86_9LAMI
MAGSDSQKQLFNLIREFSTEKSQGERRIVNQKKRIEELRSEMDASNTELEEAKRGKETTEQQLKGYEVELSMNEASIQALEARIALTNNEISKVGSELEALKVRKICFDDVKSEENSSRDGFIRKMLELNAKIRKFQELLPSTGNGSEATLSGGFITAHEQDVQQARKVLQNKLAELILRTEQEEEQYKAEQVIHDQVQQELVNLKRKALLLESVMRESMELQEMSRSELEGKCADLGDELQKRFLCPHCRQDNSGKLGEILQTSEAS